jgi:hypothetical protein
MNSIGIRQTEAVGGENDFPVDREQYIKASRIADKLMSEILAPEANPAKSDPHRVVVGAGEVSLTLNTIRKSRRAHSSKPDLGPRQAHAVDQYIPRTAYLDTATASYEQGETITLPGLAWSANAPLGGAKKNRTFKYLRRTADGTIAIVC